MKRIVVISAIGAIALFLLLATSCTACGCTCDTVEGGPAFTQTCSPLSPGSPTPTPSEGGCGGLHVTCDCLDCYWFPMLCGCYPNELSTNAYFGNCAMPSCVVCGYDLTFLECYGSSTPEGTDVDNRAVRDAIEGQDYRIDSFRIIVNDEAQELDDGRFTSEDIRLLIGLINLKELVTVEIYVEYTALTELHSATLAGEFDYGSAGEIISNFTDGFEVVRGNVKERYGEKNMHSKNLQPGKHMIHTVFSLDTYECLALEDITFIEMTAKAYSDGGAE